MHEITSPPMTIIVGYGTPNRVASNDKTATASIRMMKVVTGSMKESALGSGGVGRIARNNNTGRHEGATHVRSPAFRGPRSTNHSGSRIPPNSRILSPMPLITDPQNYPPHLKGPVLCIGNFDGVHL